MRRRQWIFDMDGTLTDSMGAVWYNVPEAMLRRFGREPKPGLHQTLLDMDLADSPEYIIREYSLPIDMPAYWQLMRDIVPELYKTVELKPGVRQALARLKSEGARLCICSNTWASQCKKVLGRLGVGDMFDFYITAQGAMSKQHPEVFFEAMRRLGGAAPDECVVCEDSLYAAQTAREAGFCVVGIADFYSRDDEPELRQLSTQFLRSWSELEPDKL